MIWTQPSGPLCLWQCFILNLARSCADLKIVADENTEEVKKIRHIKVGSYEWKTQNKISGYFAFKNDERISKPSKVCGDHDHGVKEGSTCTCQPGWVGDLCQYKTDCESDDDCNKVEPPLEIASPSMWNSQYDFCQIAGSRWVYNCGQRCVQTRRMFLLRRMAGPDQPSTDISWRLKFDVSTVCLINLLVDFFWKLLDGKPRATTVSLRISGSGVLSPLTDLTSRCNMTKRNFFLYLDNGSILRDWHVNWPLRWRICLRESSCSGGNMKMRWEKIEATATYDGWQLGDGKKYYI